MLAVPSIYTGLVILCLVSFAVGVSVKRRNILSTSSGGRKCLQGYCRCEKDLAICDSTNFLDNLSYSQLFSVEKLKLTGHMETVDPKLKYLRHLAELDLSHTGLKSLSDFPHLAKLERLNLSGNHLSDAPKMHHLGTNIKVLDLSYNQFEQLPRDWYNLKALSHFYFAGNRLQCDCDNAAVYSLMLAEGHVTFDGEPACGTPEHMRDLTIRKIGCNHAIEHMLGDQSGSGGAEFDTDVTAAASARDDHDDTDADGLLLHKDDATEFLLESAETMMPTYPNATNRIPVRMNGTNDEKRDPEEEDDIGSGVFDAPETTTIAMSVTRSERINQLITHFFKELDADNGGAPTTSTLSYESFDIAPPAENTVDPPLRFADINPYFVWAIVLLVVAMCILLVIFCMKGKHGNRKGGKHHRRSSEQDQWGEEMKVLHKIPSPLDSDTTKTDEEQVPLQAHANNNNGTCNDDALLSIREMLNQTPPVERVTVRASTIPNFFTRKPVFFQRKVNRNGDIVITSPATD